MAIIDILKYDGPNNVLVWKWRPQNDGKRREELRLGTQLVVNQSQQAVFIYGGQITDIFGAGTYTLTPANLPILSGLIGLAYGGRSPFKAEVYFFNKSVAMDNKFAVIPFNMLEPNFRVPIPVKSRGSFAVKIADVRTFLSQIIGTVSDFEANTLRQYFRGIISEQIKNAIIRIAREQKIRPLELEAIVIEVSDAVKGIISGTFAKYGLYLEMFNIEAISIVDEDEQVRKTVAEYQRLMSQDMEERMRLQRRAENLDIYKIERSFDTTEKAAENIGKGDGGGILGTILGLGMALPLGKTMGEMVGNIIPNTQAPVQMDKDKIIYLLEYLLEMKAKGTLTDEEFAETIKELISKNKK
jgi:membrane protease subunit (stomatin/prohibitin family)